MAKVKEKDLSTEARILDASKRVFVRKGFEGARMQEIADEAGINKSLLHYYFRSKEKLFDAVFNEAFSTLLPQIIEVIDSEASLESKIQAFVEKYNAFLILNPYLPLFILSEIQRNPQAITNRLLFSEGKVFKFLEQLRSLTDSGTPGNSTVDHIFVNLLSLTIFPIAARPLLQLILFRGDESAYSDFLDQRPTHIKELIGSLISSHQHK